MQVRSNLRRVVRSRIALVLLTVAGYNMLAPTGEARIAPSREGQIAPSRAPQPGPIFDAARAWAHLTKQVSFGPRPSGSAALSACRQYIVSELRKAGIEPRQQMFVPKTPLGEISMINVIATIPGRRPERIILASHYDTKRSPDFRFVGASDGASSTAALLELGRVLKARQNEFTIELLFLDGEEAVNWEWRDPDNTYGSRYYVQAARQANTVQTIKALILLDMIGDKNLVLERDATSTPWLVDIVWNAAARLGHRNVFTNTIGAFEDDHVPFLSAGVPAVDLIDLNNYARYWHTAQDDLEHVSEKSLKIVGDVVLGALPDIEKRLVK
jgi:glutaminyl-peptide cyclotransferase